MTLSEEYRLAGSCWPDDFAAKMGGEIAESRHFVFVKLDDGRRKYIWARPPVAKAAMFWGRIMFTFDEKTGCGMRYC